jgi:hypothetical protein
MSLPNIDPTGAMSSGNYVDYMIGYLNTALDSMDGQLDHYVGATQISDWGNQWDRTVGDVDTIVTNLENSVNKLKPQVQMITDALKRL